ADEAARFVGGERAVVAVLAHLGERGYAESSRGSAGAPRYRLTPLGELEGRRRFLDEFEPYLARHAHGECGSADCDCHSGGECRGGGWRRKTRGGGAQPCRVGDASSRPRRPPSPFAAATRPGFFRSHPTDGPRGL